MVIEIHKVTAIVIAFLIPIIIIAFSFLISYLAKKNTNSRISKIARFLSEPLQFKPIIDNQEINELPETKTRKIIGKEILKRMNFVYFIVGIFLFCSFLGELYQVLADRTLLYIFAQIVDGTSPPSSVWSSVIIESPFSSGFTGFQIWYAMYPNPILFEQYFHRTWEWIFYTSGLYNNLFPNMQYEFFGQPVNTMVYTYSSLIMVFTIIIGAIFLLQLLWRNIRESFFASLFFFEAGMIIGTKGVFSCFAQAWQIEVNGNLLQYGAFVISKTTIAAEWAILGLLPIIFGLYFLFLWIGKKIWQIHYSQTKSISKKTFLIFVSINYFIALITLLF